MHIPEKWTKTSWRDTKSMGQKCQDFLRNLFLLFRAAKSNWKRRKNALSPCTFNCIYGPVSNILFFSVCFPYPLRGSHGPFAAPLFFALSSSSSTTDQTNGCSKRTETGKWKGRKRKKGFLQEHEKRPSTRNCGKTRLSFFSVARKWDCILWFSRKNACTVS